MDKQVAEHDILWMAVDDWTGLWEAAWGIQTMWPELHGQPAKDAARSIIEKLLSEDSIYLCFFSDPNTERRVPKKRAYKLLESPENWEPPAVPGEHVRYAATDEGEKKMFELEAAIERSSKASSREAQS